MICPPLRVRVSRIDLNNIHILGYTTYPWTIKRAAPIWVRMAIVAGAIHTLRKQSPRSPAEFDAVADSLKRRRDTLCIDTPVLQSIGTTGYTGHTRP